MVGFRAYERSAVRAKAPQRISSERCIFACSLACNGGGNNCSAYPGCTPLDIEERLGSRSVVSMRIKPVFDFIRDDPRFISLLRIAGLSD